MLDDEVALPLEARRTDDELDDVVGELVFHKLLRSRENTVEHALQTNLRLELNLQQLNFHKTFKPSTPRGDVRS